MMNDWRNATLRIKQFVQIEQTFDAEIKHQITLVGNVYPLVFKYDENNQIKVPFRWNSQINEIEILTEDELRNELYTPAANLLDSFGRIVSSFDAVQGTVKKDVQWVVMRGIDFASMEARSFSADMVIEADIPGMKL